VIPTSPVVVNVRKLSVKFTRNLQGAVDGVRRPEDEERSVGSVGVVGIDRVDDVVGEGLINIRTLRGLGCLRGVNVLHVHNEVC
jgi:hypothetical protein